jgi:hypothetical protein
MTSDRDPISDPLEPSAEYRARMDQMRAAARDLSAMLDEMVGELIARGWTDPQARELVVAAIRGSQR